MDANVVANINTGLTTFGETLLNYFVQLLPALATLAAILFVISIVKRKVD